MITLTLADRIGIPNGDLLGQIDIDEANNQIARGESYDRVLERMCGWASDYAHERYADSCAAEDFEDQAYGRAVS